MLIIDDILFYTPNKFKKLLKVLLKIKHPDIYNIYKAPNYSYSFYIHFSFLFVSHKNDIYVYILFTFLF